LLSGKGKKFLLLSKFDRKRRLVVVNGKFGVNTNCGEYLKYEEQLAMSLLELGKS